jgi:DNA-binding response OmpR family regulator
MVHDGKDAVDIYKKATPDICVLDIMLPFKDGYSVAREIRQLNETVPIIFVTAKNETEDVIRGFEAGGNDYIRKPFSMEELIIRVNNLLNLAVQRTKRIPDNIEIGEYEFIPLRYELRFGATVKRLSHRESTLLQMLVENRNATVLRKDILIKLWGDDTFFNSRTLDVYITKLRDYLKADKSIEIITIKGIGYQFTVA